jgi:hypothetical protein
VPEELDAPWLDAPWVDAPWLDAPWVDAPWLDAPAAWAALVAHPVAEAVDPAGS